MTLVLAAGSRDCTFLLDSSPAPSPGVSEPTSHLPLGSRATNQGAGSYFTKISVTKSPICPLFPSSRLLRVVSYVHTGNTSSSTHQLTTDTLHHRPINILENIQLG